MNAIASLEPWRKLRIRHGPAQIDDEIARHRRRHATADFMRNDGEHEVDARCHSGAGHSITTLGARGCVRGYVSSAPAPKHPFADLAEPKDAAADGHADEPLFKRQGDCPERHVQRAKIDDRNLE